MREQILKLISKIERERKKKWVFTGKLNGQFIKKKFEMIEQCYREIEEELQTARKNVQL